MIDICFVTTPVIELTDDRLEPPLGYLYLATYLQTNLGLKVKIVDINSIPESQWDFPEAKYYGFSTYTPIYHRTLYIKKLIKNRYPHSLFIAGGAHASALPDEVIKDFDYVVTGEGEITLAQIFTDSFDPGIYKGKPIPDLDFLPFPDYDLVDVSSYHRIVGGKRGLCIQSSRGCPYKCLFCNSNIMGGHKKTRYRSPESVVNEIELLLEKYGDIGIRFQDDMFGGDMDWLWWFTKWVKSLDIVYRAFVRANSCATRDFTDLLYDGGCRHIALGIESGSDVILKAMHKGQTVAQCKEGLRNAKESGIVRRVYLIVGYPGETWDTIDETVDFIKETNPDEYAVYPLIIYPGTPLYDNPDEFGIRNLDRDFRKYWQMYGDAKSHFTYDLDNADRDELQAMKDYVIRALEDSMAVQYRKSKEFGWNEGSGNDQDMVKDKYDNTR